jgi:hypothetical protein
VEACYPFSRAMKLKICKAIDQIVPFFSGKKNILVCKSERSLQKKYVPQASK